MDDLSQGKTQVKILILYPSEHVKIRTPEDQKTIAITSRANIIGFSSEEQQARLDLTGGFSLQTPALFSV